MANRKLTRGELKDLGMDKYSDAELKDVGIDVDEPIDSVDAGVPIQAAPKGPIQLEAAETSKLPVAQAPGNKFRDWVLKGSDALANPLGPVAGLLGVNPEAFGRNFYQSALMNAGDALGAGLEVAPRYGLLAAIPAGKDENNVPRSLGDVASSFLGTPIGETINRFKSGTSLPAAKTYDQAKAALNQDIDTSTKEYPMSSLAGGFTGAATSPVNKLLPGSGMYGAPLKGVAGVGTRALGNAALGGIYGFNGAEGEDSRGLGTALGAGLGGLGSLAGEGLGWLGGKAKQALPSAILRSLRGTDEALEGAYTTRANELADEANRQLDFIEKPLNEFPERIDKLRAEGEGSINKFKSDAESKLTDYELDQASKYNNLFDKRADLAEEEKLLTEKLNLARERAAENETAAFAKQRADAEKLLEKAQAKYDALQVTGKEKLAAMDKKIQEANNAWYILSRFGRKIGSKAIDVVDSYLKLNDPNKSDFEKKGMLAKNLFDLGAEGKEAWDHVAHIDALKAERQALKDSIEAEGNAIVDNFNQDVGMPLTSRKNSREDLINMIFRNENAKDIQRGVDVLGEQSQVGNTMKEFDENYVPGLQRLGNEYNTGLDELTQQVNAANSGLAGEFQSAQEAAPILRQRAVEGVLGSSAYPSAAPQVSPSLESAVGAGGFSTRPSVYSRAGVQSSKAVNQFGNELGQGLADIGFNPPLTKNKQSYLDALSDLLEKQRASGPMGDLASNAAIPKEQAGQALFSSKPALNLQDAMALVRSAPANKSVVGTASKGGLAGLLGGGATLAGWGHTHGGIDTMNSLAAAGIGAGVGALSSLGSKVNVPAVQSMLFREAMSTGEMASSPAGIGALSRGFTNPTESLLGQWLKPGAPPDVVNQAMDQISEEARKNLIDRTNGTADAGVP